MRRTGQVGLALIILFTGCSVLILFNSGFDKTDEPIDQNIEFVQPLLNAEHHEHTEDDPYSEFHGLDEKCVPADIPPIKNIKSQNNIRAAFTYLAPRLDFFRETKRLYLLLMSLQRLEIFYYRALGLYTVNNDHSITYDYPIIIFHEDYTEREMNFLRSHMLDANFPLMFHKVDFGTLPACAESMEQVMRWNKGEDGGDEGRPVGYRQMCRMWSGIAQNYDVLKEYEFYLRLDDDTMLLGPPKYDVFQYMKERNLTYVYQQTERDIEALWYWVERWNLAHGIPWNARHNFGFFDGVKDGVLAIYNNFHASRLDLWRSSLWKDYFAFIENNSGCGFLKYVWGDATFQSAFISSTLRKSQVGIVPFSDFPYSHREIKDNMFYTGWDEWTRPLCRVNRTG